MKLYKTMVSLRYENNKERISSDEMRFLITLAGLKIQDQKRSVKISKRLQINKAKLGLHCSIPH
jgi:hypothetical protein